MKKGANFTASCAEMYFFRHAFATVKKGRTFQFFLSGIRNIFRHTFCMVLELLKMRFFCLPTERGALFDYIRNEKKRYFSIYISRWYLLVQMFSFLLTKREHFSIISEMKKRKVLAMFVCAPLPSSSVF